MKTVALLTGRGNNSYVDKNIRDVCGKPLLSYPAIAAKKSRHISEYYVSSDDEKILKIAAELGYKRIKRPDELSRPNSRHVDVITHALDVMRTQDDLEPDILVVLLANTATIKTQWIDDCIEDIVKDNKISAAVPVYLDLDHHPYRSKRIREDGCLSTFMDLQGEDVSTNRQDLEPSYYLCHNFWVLNVRKSVFQKDGQKPWAFMGSSVKPYIVEETIDVHEEEDLLRTERWLRRNKVADHIPE